MNLVDLNGTWRGALADPERRRAFADPSFDDAGREDWADLCLPGHWRSTEAFAESDGPLLHRRRFDLDSATVTEDRRWWLMLDGIFYQGDVWLDGHYLGDTEGYFFSHTFEVTDEIRSGSEHLLAVEVSCAPQSDRSAKRNLTGVLQHSNWLDPTWNPGGIWRPIRLEASGPLRIRHMRVRCIEADGDRAVLALRAVIDAIEPTSGLIQTVVTPARPRAETPGTGELSEEHTGPMPGRSTDAGGSDHQLRQVFAAGENRIEWTVTIDDPQLWWPRALGDAPLYDVVVEIAVDHDRSGAQTDPDARSSMTSDRRTVRTGLRSLHLDKWVLHVNGERMFLKGANLGPTRHALAEASPSEVIADLASAADLGLDLVRVHAHIARPELYGAADETGMLVWQDLPLQWAYSRSVRRQALRQAREAVDLLAHHPSVAVWCAHNEPLTVGLTGTGHDPDATRSERIRRVIGQVLPSWNKTVLDPSIRRTLRTTDGTRPVIAHSGVLPHLPELDGTDSHLWFGWEYGEIGELADLAARWPRLVRFVSEFGSQAVPDSAEFCEPDRWPNLDWDQLAERHGLRRDLLDRIADPGDFDDFDRWRSATQTHQALLLGRQIEILRRLKYRPTGGFAQFMLADGHPAISHSLLDHERRPKLAYDAVRDACRPVIVVAGGLPGQIQPGRSLDVDIHLVSDLRQVIPAVTIDAHVSGGGNGHRRWTGDVARDSCTFIGSVTILPNSSHQPIILDLIASDADGVELTTNRYVSASDQR